MAEVWLATDTLLNRQVAVKVLKPALAADPVVAERFRREAVAVAGLNHPNIVAIYDTVDERGRQAVVMQFVPGRSLRQILDDDRTLSPEMTMRIGASVAAALDSAHRAGLVHRDVKPGNILVTPEGRVLLTDFGIAKALSGEGDLTSDNVMMGTAKYLSPEQVRGRRLDGRADLYSLGLVLYECLAGRVPFLGDNDAATALARLQRDPTPILRLRPTLPAGLGELIHRLLARNPDERPATGASVHTTLERIRTGPDDPTSPTPAPGALSRQGSSARTLTAHGQPTNRSADGRSGATGRVTNPRPGEGQPALGGPPSASNRQPTPPRPRPVPLPDPTPSAGLRITGRPARQFQQRWTPSLIVVGGLLLAALVLTVALLATLGDDSAGNAAPADTAANGETTVAATSDTAATGPPTISSLIAYDPNGDGSEFNEYAPSAADESETTSWQTECYANQYMGGKHGVGIVLELSQTASGELDVTFGATPWSAEIYAADEVPATMDPWGGRVDSGYSEDAAGATFDLGPTPHRFVLVWLTRLATDPGCSGDHPYRGKIAEISFSPA